MLIKYGDHHCPETSNTNKAIIIHNFIIMGYEAVTTVILLILETTTGRRGYSFATP